MTKGLEKFTYADLARLERPEPPAQKLPASAAAGQIPRDAREPISLGNSALIPRENTIPNAPRDNVPAVPRESRSERSRQVRRQRQVNLSLDADLAEEIASAAIYLRRPLLDCFQEGMLAWIANYRQSGALPCAPCVPNVPRENCVPRDDLRMMIDDDDWAAAVEIYQDVTGNEYRDSDREFLEAMQHAGYGARCVALGILIGRSRQHKRIGSLKYFYHNILEVAAYQPDRIEKELSYQLEMVRRRSR